MFNHFWTMVRFILRRERIVAPIWIISIVGFTVAIAPALREMYGTEEQLTSMALMMGNPAMVAMVGPAFDIENFTYGGLFATMMLLFMAMTVAIMNIYLVNRHTRVDEEVGRLEVIRSLPIGRLTVLGATFFVSVVFNVIIGVLTGVGLGVLGIETLTMSGSLVFGVAMGALGIVYAGVTGVFTQLASTSRGALAYSFVFLIVDYMVRAVGDMENNVLAFIAPMGLILRTEAYVNNYWLPIFVLLGVGVVLGIIAFAFLATRDLGAGIIPQRSGRSSGTKWLVGYQTFTVKLLRNMIIGWAIGGFIIGVAYGSIFGDIEDFVSGNEFLAQMFTGNQSLVDQFIPFLMVVMALISAIPVLICVLRVRSEEKNGYMDQISGNAVSRQKVLGSYGIVAFVTSGLMLLINGISFWASANQVVATPIPITTFLASSMVYLPALWVLIGMALFLVGFFPKGANAIWIYLVAGFIFSYFGQLMDFPTILTVLTPFGHVPRLPIDEMAWAPMFVMTGIAIVLAVVGFVGYKKRDLHS